MQKKNIVFIATSLDGYIAGKNGELDWLETVPNTDSVEMGFTDLMQQVDALVMGRNTYEVVCGFGGEWPYSKHVFVLSTTLDAIPAQLSGKVSLLKGAPQEVVHHIHNKGYDNLYIDGGKTIQDFLKAGLIDELIITTIPILLGGGFPLFGELPQALKLELIDSKVFLNQIVQSHYRLLV